MDGWRRCPAATERGRRQSAEGREAKESPYFVQHGRICRQRYGKDGEIFNEPLCNFVAKIEAETIYDDGSGEIQHCFRVAGRLADGQPLATVDVPSTDFAAMGWTLKHWGVPRIVSPGQGAKDHLRAAIQELSKDATREVVYRQTGCARSRRTVAIPPRWWVHWDGWDGPVHTIDLPGNLTRMTLPDPPEGADLASAVRASLHILDLCANVSPLLSSALSTAPSAVWTSLSTWSGRAGASRLS